MPILVKDAIVWLDSFKIEQKKSRYKARIVRMFFLLLLLTRRELIIARIPSIIDIVASRK